jgi:two-component sensor histidine kinase
MLQINSFPRISAYEETQLLLHEFNHRINNEFAAAIALISLAAARTESAEARATLLCVRDRLFNYARVFHVLQKPESDVRIDAAAYLRRLCLAISQSKLEAKGIRLFLVERKFRISSERCWRLGLIISELVTNSFRHAFDESGGEIRVELLPSSDFIECRVTDNGRAASYQAPGQGMKLVGALAQSLDGTIKHSFGPRGKTSVLVFPTRSRSNCDLCR